MSSDAVTRVSVEIGANRPEGGTNEITFETGRMAKQASGSVVVRQGDTMVLCTAVAGSLRDVDFLPLTVDVEERMYAAGKIPGSFFKREGRPGEKGTLTARMIDRPIRPLFPKEWRFDTQLVAIPLSIDHVHPYDILAMNGASAALMISDIPLPTPVGAVRIGKVDGDFVVNPPEPDLLADGDSPSDLDLIVAGTEEAILMVEAGANEIPEAEILDALDIAHAEIKKLCALQRDLAAKVGKEKKVFETISVDADLLEQIRSSHGADLDAATQVEDKLERQEATKAVEAAILEHYAPSATDGAGEEQALAAKLRRAAVQLAFDKLEKSIIRERIAVHKKRPDGRSEKEIRDISIEVGVLPRTHGSALFTRGQTQALSVVAMGTLKEEMRLDTLGLETKKYYWHHYNFPPFSVGEAGRMGGVKRRDIGHGALAERALAPMIPTIEEFPYSIRVVSDILESNGSSSMASVCGSSLSLMDAGVPIKRPVAGIAMGLIKEGDDYVVLTDIAGVEDHLGDMDFKVAGTDRGITALQMDIKITGVTFEILRDALTQAKEARTFILGKMQDTIGAPREQLSQFAPRIQTIQIDPSQIGLLIGKGGETIRGLADEFESQIDVNDDGQVLIYSANGELGDA
ncbi:MAG: polyribonucleotide nucleotidyltransferase, partial [Solirubrobacteraceae bacterium]|nr:polyribonucleotide nucleotidyltransferase [Solirubrobacteraceae bacterium]